MNMAKRWLIGLILLFGLLALPGCALRQALREAKPTPAPPVEVQVSADQVAQAMQADEFYAAYQGKRLLVTGKVQAVDHQGGHTQVKLETELPTKVVCDLGTQTVTVQPGDQVTVQALASDAERGASLALLKNCRLH